MNVSVMGLGGTGMVMNTPVIHQPSVAQLPFRYRYPLRHKAPAASSGRLTHNVGHQCDTAPFRPLRNAPSQRPKCPSIHPSARLHAQWKEVDLKDRNGPDHHMLTEPNAFQMCCSTLNHCLQPWSQLSAINLNNFWVAWLRKIPPAGVCPPARHLSFQLCKGAV